MRIMLTSYLGGAGKVDGVRKPSILVQDNGQLSCLRSMWPENANVLIVCADPKDYDKNDKVCECLRQSFPMSGLSVSNIDKCDDRNCNIVDNLNDFNVLLLAGGHVPTQNKFMQQIKLRERLLNYNGVAVAWSAGSMNCADIVYASPELDGEAVDPYYERWITGLGLTNINIYPHYQLLKDECLDGLRVIEDITFVDSFTHEIVALNDGSYILIDGDKTIIYGEAYLIKDGKLTQICTNGESRELL